MSDEWSHEEQISYTDTYGAGCIVFAALTYAYVLRQVPKQRRDGKVVPFQPRLAFFLTSSPTGFALEVLMAVFSIGSCVVFVWESYLPQSPLWMFWIELLFSTFFAFQYFLGYYVAGNKLAYVTQLQPLVDAVTVTPVFILFFSGTYSLSGGNVGFLRFSRVMKFARVLRLLRLLRSAAVVQSVTADAIQNQMVSFVTLILSLLVCTTGFVQFLSSDVENDPGDWGSQEGPMDFHDALYFTVVTFSLVGYGDVAPRQAIGRLAIQVVIVTAFLAVPIHMNKLIRLHRMRSAYSGNMETTVKESHVILACDARCMGIQDFLVEFFHEDHGAQNSRVCIVTPDEPSLLTQELILKFRRVTYLKGDLMNGDDCQRARLDVADAVFLLADRFSRNPEESDSVTVLRALTTRVLNPSVPVFAMTLSGAVKTHIIEAGVPSSHILCVNEIKLRLIGQNTINTGIATVVTNIVKSMSSRNAIGGKPWMDEYMNGVEQEMYNAEVPARFVGHAFPDVVHSIFMKFGVLLFGVRVTSRGVENIAVNPGRSYSMRAGDVGFFIGDDQKQIDCMLLDKVWLRQAPSLASALSERAGSMRNGFRQRRGQSSYTLRSGHVHLEPEPTYSGSQETDQLEIRQRSAPSASPLRIANSLKNMSRRIRGMKSAGTVLPALSQETTILMRTQSLHVASPHRIRKLRNRVDKKMPGLACGSVMGVRFRSIEALLYEGLDDAGDTAASRKRERRERLLSSVQDFIERGFFGICTDIRSEVEVAVSAASRSILDEPVDYSIINIPRRGTEVAMAPSQFELLYGRKSWEQCVRHTVKAFLYGHIIVVTKRIVDLTFLLEALRAPGRKQRPVVILSSAKPPDRDWQPVGGCPDIHFVQGSQLHVADLRRAGLDTAHAVVILSDTAKPSTGYFSGGDAEMVLTHRIVRQQAPHVKIMSELNNVGFIKHLKDAAHVKSVEPHQRPSASLDSNYVLETPFMSGHVLNSSFLDALLCQAFFNPSVISVVDTMLASDYGGRRGSEVFNDGNGAAFMQQGKAGPATPLPGRPAQRVRRSRNGLLRRMPVERRFIGKKYAALFTYLVFECDVLPIGLLRAAESSAAPAPFVATNPPKDALLRTGDLIFAFVRRDSARSWEDAAVEDPDAESESSDS